MNSAISPMELRQIPVTDDTPENSSGKKNPGDRPQHSERRQENRHQRRHGKQDRRRHDHENRPRHQRGDDRRSRDDKPRGSFHIHTGKVDGLVRDGAFFLFLIGESVFEVPANIPQRKVAFPNGQRRLGDDLPGQNRPEVGQVIVILGDLDQKKFYGWAPLSEWKSEAPVDPIYRVTHVEKDREVIVATGTLTDIKRDHPELPKQTKWTVLTEKRFQDCPNPLNIIALQPAPAK